MLLVLIMTLIGAGIGYIAFSTLLATCIGAAIGCVIGLLLQAGAGGAIGDIADVGVDLID